MAIASRLPKISLVVATIDLAKIVGDAGQDILNW